MKPKVVVTHWIHQEVIDFLSPWCDLVLNQQRSSLSREEVLRRTQDAQGLMVFMPDRVDEPFLRACPQLEIISAVLKGYDNFDVKACEKHGVWFTIEHQGLTDPTAELTIGLMICLSRHVLPSDRQIRQGDFPGWRPIWYGAGISGSTVGLIGLGAIGKAIARRLKDWGCQMIYHDLNRLDPALEQEMDIKFSFFEDVVSSADFLIPMLPYNRETHHLLNSETLGGIKPGAFLINTGRGSVVDEEAVARLLRSGLLGGYAADVFEFEDWARMDRPRSINPKLVAFKEKTLFTQHLGSAVDRVRKEIALSAAEKILRVFNGESPTGAIARPR